MFDYERYDHTYCRLTKETEDSGSLKRRFSSASNDGLSDVDLNEHLKNQISFEKDNGSSLNREPVIIVRTKKARKTAPAPIIVKAVNQDKEAAPVSALNTANSSNSIISKNKIVSPVAVQAELEEPVDCKKTATAEVNVSDNMECVSDGEVKAKVDVPVNVIQTTKSGRPRKLTAKAKQICDESVSKARKSLKAKANSGKESGPKRSRGRPKKNVGVNGAPAATATSLMTTVTASVEDPKPDSGENSEDKDNSDDQPVSVKVCSDDEQTKSQGRKKIARKVTKNETLPTQSARVRKPTDKSVQAKKTVAKSVPVKSSAVKKTKSKSSGVTKQNPSVKSKLLVVTKPPPKRQAQKRAQDQKAAVKTSSHSIPAAKIDSNNIVRGSRRRR